MTGDFGLSFAPTSQNEAQNAQQATPIQDAIKVLSLRIPQFVGAKGMAPDALMGGMGGSGLGGGTPGGLEHWLMQLFGQMGGGGQFPTPNITPGGGDDKMTDPGDGTMIGGMTNPGGFSPGGGPVGGDKGFGPRPPSNWPGPQMPGMIDRGGQGPMMPGGPRPPRNPFGGGPRMPGY